MVVRFRLVVLTTSLLLTGAMALASVVALTGTTSLQTNASGETEVKVQGSDGAAVVGRSDMLTDQVDGWKKLVELAGEGKKVKVRIVDGHVKSFEEVSS